MGCVGVFDSRDPLYALAFASHHGAEKARQRLVRTGFACAGPWTCPLEPDPCREGVWLNVLRDAPRAPVPPHATGSPVSHSRMSLDEFESMMHAKRKESEVCAEDVLAEMSSVPMAEPECYVVAVGKDRVRSIAQDLSALPGYVGLASSAGFGYFNCFTLLFSGREEAEHAGTFTGTSTSNINRLPAELPPWVRPATEEELAENEANFAALTAARITAPFPGFSGVSDPDASDSD